MVPEKHTILIAHTTHTNTPLKPRPTSHDTQLGLRPTHHGHIHLQGRANRADGAGSTAVHPNLVPIPHSIATGHQCPRHEDAHALDAREASGAHLACRPRVPGVAFAVTSEAQAVPMTGADLNTGMEARGQAAVSTTHTKAQQERASLIPGAPCVQPPLAFKPV